jgi:hypothetical protein
MSTQDFHILIHIDNAFCLCMTRHFMLCEQRRLLQWLNPSFSVFQFSPFLIASHAALGGNDTPKACFC